jgi:NADPH:quinone reductase
MRTVIVSRFGDPQVLEPRDAPTPRPGPGQVLINVQVVEVLFLDTQLRAGWGQDFFPMRPPFIPGTGVGGTVGTRRVIARTGNQGAYAQQVLVPYQEAIDVPDGLELAVALAALHDGVLAQHRIELTPLTAGARVLITAAAGSLGHWIVPLAKTSGATVIGAAGGPRKAQAVRRLGADLAVDYRKDGWVQRSGGPFDVVFDGVGGAIGRTALAHTVDGGRFHAYGAASGEFATTPGERRIEVFGVEQTINDDTWRRLVRSGLDLLAAGRVTPTIGQRVPLERAADAHAAIERREVIGKTVLTL